MNMTGGYMLKIKISISMPNQQKHRLSMHNTNKTGNMVIKLMQLDDTYKALC